MGQQLKRCPFCGGPAVIVQSAAGSPLRGRRQVACVECYTRSADGVDTEEAAELWNRRPAEADALRARAEAAEARAAQAEADARLMAGLAFADFVGRTSFSAEIVDASLLDALEAASDHTAAVSDAGLIAAARRILAGVRS